MANGVCCFIFLVISIMVTRSSAACKADEFQKELGQCNVKEPKLSKNEDREKVKEAVCCVMHQAEKCMKDAMKKTNCESMERELKNALAPLNQILQMAGMDCTDFNSSHCGAGAMVVALWLLLLAPLVSRWMH